MKTFVLLSLFAGGFSFAGEIHPKKDEVTQVVVEGCKSSEYGAVRLVRQNGVESNAFVARCLPKTCIYGGSSLFGFVIRLYPGAQKLAEPETRSELDATLDQLVKNGVCAEYKREVPSM